uniref:Uncharacterized protein n=1 Tax=Oryza nivara TaxID=4536 RepID=A0A0E0IGE1_ORYNI
MQSLLLEWGCLTMA